MKDIDKMSDRELRNEVRDLRFTLAKAHEAITKAREMIEQQTDAINKLLLPGHV
jgi:hypothetical protein